MSISRVTGAGHTKTGEQRHGGLESIIHMGTCGDSHCQALSGSSVPDDPSGRPLREPLQREQAASRLPGRKGSL